MQSLSEYAGSKNSSIFLQALQGMGENPVTTKALPSSMVGPGIIQPKMSFDEEETSLDVSRIREILQRQDSDIITDNADADSTAPTSPDPDGNQAGKFFMMRNRARVIAQLLDSKSCFSPSENFITPSSIPALPLTPLSTPPASPKTVATKRNQPSAGAPPKLLRIEPLHIPTPLPTPLLSPVVERPLYYLQAYGADVLPTPPTTPPPSPKGELLCDESMAQITPQRPKLHSRIAESPSEESIGFVRESPECPLQLALDRHRTKSRIMVTLESEEDHNRRLFHSKYWYVSVPSFDTIEGYVLKLEERPDHLPLNSPELDYLVKFGFSPNLISE